MIEETGEIARQLFNQEARPDLYNEENIKEEICDVILESIVLASFYDMNLGEELKRKLDKLYKEYKYFENSKKVRFAHEI